MPVCSTKSSQSSFNPTQLPVYTPSASPSPKFLTVERYLNAFHSMDYDGCLSLFDENLEHRIIPQSLGRPVLNKRQYGEYFRGIMPRYKWLRFTLHEVIETEDKMTIHGTVKGESVKGTPYNNEYIFLLHFSPLEEGATEQKICLVKEFVDSDSITKFYAEDAAKGKTDAQKGNSHSSLNSSEKYQSSSSMSSVGKGQSNGSMGSIGGAQARVIESTRHELTGTEERESPRIRERPGHYVPARS